MLGFVVIEFDSFRFDEVVSTCCHLFVSLCQVFRFVFIDSTADVCLLPLTLFNLLRSCSVSSKAMPGMVFNIAVSVPKLHLVVPWWHFALEVLHSGHLSSITSWGRGQARRYAKHAPGTIKQIHFLVLRLVFDGEPVMRL